MNFKASEGVRPLTRWGQITASGSRKEKRTQRGSANITLGCLMISEKVTERKFWQPLLATA